MYGYVGINREIHTENLGMTMMMEMRARDRVSVISGIVSIKFEFATMQSKPRRKHQRKMNDVTTIEGAGRTFEKRVSA